MLLLLLVYYIIIYASEDNNTEDIRCRSLFGNQFLIQQTLPTFVLLHLFSPIVMNYGLILQMHSKEKAIYSTGKVMLMQYHVDMILGLSICTSTCCTLMFHAYNILFTCNIVLGVLIMHPILQNITNLQINDFLLLLL